MTEYKGIYYNDSQEQRFYEGGAHFKYKDLVKVLQKLENKSSQPSKKIFEPPIPLAMPKKSNHDNIPKTRNPQFQSIKQTKTSRHFMSIANKTSSLMVNHNFNEIIQNPKHTSLAKPPLKPRINNNEPLNNNNNSNDKKITNNINICSSISNGHWIKINVKLINRQDTDKRKDSTEKKIPLKYGNNLIGNITNRKNYYDQSSIINNWSQRKCSAKEGKHQKNNSTIEPYSPHRDWKTILPVNSRNNPNKIKEINSIHFGTNIKNQNWKKPEMMLKKNGKGDLLCFVPSVKGDKSMDYKINYLKGGEQGEYSIKEIKRKDACSIDTKITKEKQKKWIEEFAIFKINDAYKINKKISLIGNGKTNSTRNNNNSNGFQEKFNWGTSTINKGSLSLNKTITNSTFRKISPKAYYYKYKGK